MTYQKPPTLRFNPESGFMECYLLIRVETGRYKQRLRNKVDENPRADPSDPQTWGAAADQIGRPSEWLTWPGTDLIPVYLPSVEAPTLGATRVAPMKPKPAAEVPKKTQAILIEERLREAARHVPPHLWDEQCRTPIAGPEVTDSKEREDRGRLRYSERQVLKALCAEWEAGTFTLDEEAKEQERAWREQQESKLTTTLDAVKEAVNGSRIH